nr:MAG TPA: hypothetical protein [Bacteriophage sp.]
MYKLRDRETRIFWDLSLFLTLKRRFSERRHKKGGKVSGNYKKSAVTGRLRPLRYAS